MFRSNSRYSQQPLATHLDGDGRLRPYLLLREVPALPERSVADPIHVVIDGDRIDRVAWKQLGDPELFWRVCDANGAMHPGELTEVAGRRLIVPLEQRRPPP